MADNASLFQGAQIGVESTPGTPVAATHKLASIEIEAAMKPTIKTFKPVGTKFVTVSSMGKEEAELSYKGEPTYNELQYILASLMNNATPAAGVWTFDMSPNAADTPAVYTVETGGPTRGQQFSYAIIDSMTL